MPSSSPPTVLVECTVCCDSNPTNTPTYLTITGDVVCLACFAESVQPMFLAALAHEHDYPVKWGTAALDAQEFATHLPAGFMLRWVWREREYRTPVRERVYCRHKKSGDGVEECGNFFGAKVGATGAGCVYCCVKCKGCTCGVCAVSFAGDAKRHVCADREGAQATAAKDDPFRGLQRGKDYQLCPKCGVHITLRDGCNHLSCSQAGCGASFCYICGAQIARVEHEHFKPGKPCPRYNQPGAGNAHHDDHHHHHNNDAATNEWVARIHHIAHALQIIGPLHNQAHILVNAEPGSAVAQGILALMHQLEASLTLQLFDPTTRTEIDFLERERVSYLAAYDAIEDAVWSLLGEDDDAWAGWPGLPRLLELHQDRHEVYLDSMDARLDTLWDERMQTLNLPDWYDRALYRALEYPRVTVQAQDSAHAVRDNLMALPADTLTASQCSILRVAVAVGRALHWQLVFPAVRTVAALEMMRDKARVDDGIVEEEAWKVGGAVWNGYLGLRLAVEVRRGERGRFEAGVEGRLGVLRESELRGEGL
ncbi:hypothetical protein LTR36_002854 [Oleoguttula mirabilis]|uniref:RING-type domain-containing protein n=1 Tax=Oleoguttula mirabilis TaxID=1507867 RepID=A0AAV9JJB9_9PEZI|nr:hypothetical protein LTR36_002854 [Oleoguttula mirabilis]